MRLRSAQLLVAALLAIAVAAPQVPAQTSDAVNPAAKSIAMAAKLPAYDVVSIHENKSGDPNWSFQITDDGFVAEKITLTELIQFAYNLGSPDLISDISGPLGLARFDIRAKALNDGAKPAKYADEQLQAMIIPLLAARFRLKVRLAPKTMTVYELVVARGGPKFKLSQPETDSENLSTGFSGNDNTLVAKKTTMQALADALSGSPLHRIVVNHTGLKGEGDFSLKWSSDTAEQQDGPNVVSIFTAIQDQLGLKLQPAKLPVDTLVIDHAEMPSEN